MVYLTDTFHAFSKILFFGIGVPLISIFFLGFICALLQAVTQIQDQVLSFFPKIALCFVIVFIGSGRIIKLVSTLLEECLELIVLIK